MATRSSCSSRRDSRVVEQPIRTIATLAVVILGRSTSLIRPRSELQIEHRVQTAVDTSKRRDTANRNQRPVDVRPSA